MTEEIETLLDELAREADRYANCRYQDRKKIHAEVFTLALKLGEAWDRETADSHE